MELVDTHITTQTRILHSRQKKQRAIPPSLPQPKPRIHQLYKSTLHTSPANNPSTIPVYHIPYPNPTSLQSPNHLPRKQTYQHHTLRLSNLAPFFGLLLLYRNRGGGDGA
ncbi:hypothetical protein VTJ04DRAFT_6558 [Mycothermus thermophilus]|uniref:uncharacterized protein n=1 Tax=Humicola insolens TaxID=85995 RepID=UPI0037444AC9